jgi:hypothetical protein
MAADPILAREEALDAIWILTDILAELKKIRRVLEDGEEEEEDLGE